MNLKPVIGLPLVLLVLGACAHNPSKEEITAFRAQQSDVSRIESLLYNDKESSQGLSEQLRSCAMQLHDRVNPEEAFQWYETVDRHSDKDYFANPDNEMKYEEFQMLSEKYKIYRQYDLARKENYENRIKSCKSDLKSAMAHEKLRLDQERALLDSLNKATEPHAVAAASPSPSADSPSTPLANATPKPAVSTGSEARTPASVTKTAASPSKASELPKAPTQVKSAITAQSDDDE